MSAPTTNRLRVRYSETDQMGTFYNSRALEWFEVGRTEHLRQLGLSYREMESRGLMLPLVEAHLLFTGRAQYDDELAVTVTAQMSGRARVRFDVEIQQAQGGGKVASGYTVHAITDTTGRPMRPPQWLGEILSP
jgi:acyl-CoA thioester hydrolase